MHESIAWLGLGAGLAAVAAIAHGADVAHAAPAARNGDGDNCAALARTARDMFPDKTTVITSAVLQPASAPAKGARGGVTPAHPANCEILGTIDDRISTVDGQRYAIKFHMRLPVAAKWNGRFFMEGGGGYNGNLSEAFGTLSGADADGDALARGFAVIATDSGHDNKTNNRPDAGGMISFGGDPKARSDYFYNSYDEVTRLGKALVRLYYGRVPVKSYFVGCSEGGREGLMISQRFYDEYDGIVAGDPVIRGARRSFSSIRNAQVGEALAGKMGVPINKTVSPQDMELVAGAVLKACDGLDGLADGMVSNPAACTDDKLFPALDGIVCAGAKTDSCLTRDQMDAIKAVVAPVRNAKGQEISPGSVFDPGMGGVSGRGINDSWATGVFGSYAASGPRAVSGKLTRVSQVLPMLWTSPPHPMAASEALKYILNYDYSQASPDPAVNYPAAGPFTEAPGATEASDSTDLTGLKRKGGKLILFHGVGDPDVPYTQTVEWYSAMNARMASSAFARLFLVPGMNHCRGGPATDKFDMLTPLVNWVEKGIAPDQIVAEASDPSYFKVAKRSRPLCPWPQWPHYNGTGDINEAASFTCSQT